MVFFAIKGDERIMHKINGGKDNSNDRARDPRRDIYTEFFIKRK